MSRLQMFGLGALGGLLPVIVSMVTVDLAPIIDHMNNLTTGICVGYCIRVVGLLVLGGTVAVLNSEVQQPLSLVQLGIAAPALVTSFINGAPPAAAQSSRVSLAIVSSAHAQEMNERPIRLAGGFMADVAKGIGMRLDTANAPLAPLNSAAPSYPPTVAPNTSSHGTFCLTPTGKFGPGPVNSVGTPCTVQTPAGAATGAVVD